MSEYIQKATRAELRQFSDTFRTSWNAIVSALFDKCNDKSDEILRRYESWYTQSTQAVFDDMYRKDLLAFAWRRRFWEVFAVLGAIAGALTVVIGWGPSRRWVSVAVLADRRWHLVRRLLALGPPAAAGAGEGRAAQRGPVRAPGGRPLRHRIDPAQGRRTTAAFGMAGMFLGSAAAGGLGGAGRGRGGGNGLGQRLRPLRQPHRQDAREHAGRPAALHGSGPSAGGALRAGGAPGTAGRRASADHRKLQGAGEVHGQATDQAARLRRQAPATRGGEG